MASTVMAPEPTTPKVPLLRRPRVARLLLIALLAEIGYAVLNISTMPVYLRGDRQFGESFIGYVLVAFLFCEAVEIGERYRKIIKTLSYKRPILLP